MRSKKIIKKYLFAKRKVRNAVTHFRIECSNCVCNFNEIDQYITTRNSVKNY